MPLNSRTPRLNAGAYHMQYLLHLRTRLSQRILTGCRKRRCRRFLVADGLLAAPL